MPRLAFLLIFFFAFFVLGSYGAPTDPDVAPEPDNNYDESSSSDDVEFPDDKTADAASTTVNADEKINMKTDVKVVPALALELDGVDSPIQDNSLATVTSVPELPGTNETTMTEVVPDVAPLSKENPETTAMTSTTAAMAENNRDPSDTQPGISESTPSTSTTPISSDSETMATMSQEGTAGVEFNFPMFFSQFGRMYAALMEAKSRNHEHLKGQTESRDYETMAETPDQSKSRDMDMHIPYGGSPVSFMGAQIVPEFEDDPNPKVITFTPGPAPAPPTKQPASATMDDMAMTQANHGIEILPLQQFHEDDTENSAGYHGKCRHNRVAPLYPQTPYYVVMVHVPIPVFHHVPMTYEGMPPGYGYHANYYNMHQQAYTPALMSPQGKM